MSKPANNRISEILKEIYEIDEELKQFEADLPNLITALEANRPEVVIDKQFTDNLRASLLAYKSAPTGVASPYSNSLFWWLSRLAPIGLAVFLLITILPERHPGNDPLISPEMSPSANDENISQMQAESMSKEAGTEGPESGIRMMKMAITPLEVPPPLPGNQATVTRVTVPEAGWLVVYADDGGAFGELLGTVFLESGEYFDQTLTLTKDLKYPGMITLVVYTGNNRQEFIADNEALQIDPITNSPIMVTVPVISQLELELVE